MPRGHDEREHMEWTDIQQDWPQYKRRVQQHWNQLTESDLDRVAGRQDLLAGRIEQLYGMTQEQAQRAISEFARALPAEKREDNSRKQKLYFNESISGLKVIAADGRQVGEIGDLLIDTGSWLVEFVQLKVDKDVADELGVQHGRFHAGTVDLPVHMIQSVGDNVILSVPADRLRPTLRIDKDAA